MEAYDRGLAEKMIAHFDDVKSHVIPITLVRMAKRPLLIKLRDALAKLFSPYL
jgi:cardiolipin synthase